MRQDRSAYVRPLVAGCAMLAALFCWTGPVAPASEPPGGVQATHPADECTTLADRLTERERALADRTPSVEQGLQDLARAIEALDTATETRPAPDVARDRDRLILERAALQSELNQLRAARASTQAAMDACERLNRLTAERDQFHARWQRRELQFVPADITAIEAQIAQLQSARTALEAAGAIRRQRLETLPDLIEQAEESARRPLEAERQALAAEHEAARFQDAALAEELDLLRARLNAARESVAATQPPDAPATETAPASEEAAAINRERLAEQIQAEARDRLNFARERLAETIEKLERAEAEGLDLAPLERDREYWQRVETTEERKLRQVDLQRRAAREKQAIAQISDVLAGARRTLEELEATRDQLPMDQRRERAEQFLADAEVARQRAGELDERAEAEVEGIEPIQQILHTLNSIEQALSERLRQADLVADYQQLAFHFRRMKRQLDEERQLVDLMVARLENVVFGITRQATLNRRLAETYEQCARILVPLEPTFWERNEHVINSIKIIAAVVVLSYLVRTGVWLVQHLIAWLNHAAGGRISVRRVGTLLSFASSMIRLFLWIFGVVWVLSEFGVNPATTTGAIGLIGLILAGMFQQIVIDFVKGLDIVTGRHYNVGDFVEVDGKFGHVVDFNVKHTRIRTISGQEFNIPNSRCVPSRRFPDGYVNNYVDLALKSPADEARARAAIDPVRHDLNERIEAVRDLPAMVWRFNGTDGRVTLRYRIRVLPGCDWVVKDHFIPSIKTALADAGIELAREPSLFYINRINRFRQLFSRQLSEEEITREEAMEETAR